MDWLWQGTTTEVIGIIIGLIGSAVAAWMKERGYSLWTDSTRYGLTVFALLIVSWAGIKTILRQEPAKPEPITAQNVEEHVKKWLEHFRIGSRNEPQPETTFRRIATLMDGNNVIIYSKPELDRYIILNAVLRPSDADAEIIGKLTPAQLEMVNERVKLEAARAKVVYGISRSTFMVLLEKRIPLTANLDEALFVQQIDELDSATVLIQLIVRNTIRALKAETK